MMSGAASKKGNHFKENQFCWGTWVSRGQASQHNFLCKQACSGTTARIEEDLSPTHKLTASGSFQHLNGGAGN